MLYNAPMRTVAHSGIWLTLIALAAAVALAFGCGARGDDAPTTQPDADAAPVAMQPSPAPTAVPTDAPTPAPTAVPPRTPTPAPTLVPTVTATPAPTPRVIRRASGGEPETAPDFTVETFEGETLRLSDLRGQVVVLNFWASWCPPCRWEMPFFETISQEYKERDVVFLGIAMSDTMKDAGDFADAAGVTYPLALDTTNEIARDYEVLGLPTTFLIDKDGAIKRRLGVANEGVLKIFLNGQLGER